MIRFTFGLVRLPKYNFTGPTELFLWTFYQNSCFELPVEINKPPKILRHASLNLHSLN